MIIFPIMIILTMILYVFFKVKILSLKEPLLMRYTNAKARITLGLFIIFFAINQYLFYESTLSLIVGILFLFFGVLQTQYGIKLLRFFRKQIVEHAVVEN
jgi:hypothetical protein